MKEKLNKLLQAKREQRDMLNNSMIESENREERAEIGETLKALAEEIAEIETMLAEADKPADDNGTPASKASSDENKTDERGLNVMSTMEMRDGAPAAKINKYDTEEYRTAFMNFACRGVAIPVEYRADAITTTTDASAVIPTTILNEMVVQLKNYGNVYARVRKLNVQGGVKIPILSLKPTATWITADNGSSESDKQKIQANTAVTFNYYGLECKIAQSLLVNVTTLDMFQQMFVPLAVEAISKALDIAIINGSGSGEPLGIAEDTRIPASQVVTLAAADVASWSAWKKKVFAKIPASYRNGTFIMAQGTFDGYIDGMVDSNGQPIGRINYGIDNGETYRFGGKEVLIVEPDVIKDWDSATGHASTGDVIAVFANLNDYGFNSNLEMQTVKWTDNDTNEVKTKVILIGDGKLIDPNGVVVVKKGV
jgi:HK97 family phage major capsid protein